MNALLIAIIAIVFFGLAYRFYASKIEKLWGIDPKRSTPAFTKYDSLDYIPAKNWLVLFGHHFSSISGAGPIIGPVIAVMLWGWLPAFIWVILGTIFIGGIHDFGSLITSVRENGSSVADIAQEAISKRAKIIFSLFLWLSLILVVAVFAYLCADTFVKQPQIVMPSLGLIPVSIAVGILLYRLRLNIVLVTTIGVLCMIGLIFAGGRIPIVNNSFFFWLVILFLYAYCASIMPVNILLQPRDYLSSFLLFFGVGAGYLGLVLSNPKISLPAYTGWSPDKQHLWPMLFVTVACGAVSGFHALISSGTSSKQIANERQIKRIGYGGMVTEGIVAVLAIIAVGVLFTRGDDLALKLKSLTPVGIYAQGYGLITKSIFKEQGAFLAIVILNAFILTTLDTATRIARYLTEELFLIKSRYFSTLIIVVLGALLAFSGKWLKVWPVFGASNQLVAALTLFVLSCWLLSKNKSAVFTLWAGVFMLITSVAALVIQFIKYFLNKDIVLVIASGALIVLAGFMVREVIPVVFSRRKKHA